MKKILFLAGLVTVLAMSGCIENTDSHSIVMNDVWRFSQGDSMAWARPGFNDSGWDTIDPYIVWEDQGFDGIDGFGWYRYHVVIPSSLKEDRSYGDSLQIFLGKIDDCDQVFLNGSLIGENGVTIAAGKPGNPMFHVATGIWDLPRKYLLSKNDPMILWDKENVIAIRCYDHGGIGGAFSQPFKICMSGLSDYLRFDFETHPFTWQGDSLVKKKLLVINTSGNREFKGELIIRVREYLSGIELYNEKAGVLITESMKLEKNISFEMNPASVALMEVTFTDFGGGESIRASAEVPYILTPRPGPFPSINGAKIFGVRPWSPVHYKIAATGEPPMVYHAETLPAGLAIDTLTGMITGSLKKKGEYVVEMTVSNRHGVDTAPLKIVVGDVISLTPPMGWNSWNCWGLSVSDKKIRQSATAMKNSGLIDYGWSYINIDDGWEDKHDASGTMLTNYKFTDMKGLCSYIHALGLKAGIYSSPGPRTCGGYEGSYTFEEKDAQAFAAWGFDYLKYDWCSYGRIAPDPTLEQMKAPYKLMRHAIRRVNRDIHYSLCQYGMGDVWTWGAEVDGNSWRTTGDITDTWESMSSIGFSQDSCARWAGPGRWNDPDMLVVGWVGWGPNLHYTRLTPSEQYTHITLWSLLASPLLIGCDLERLDPFTLNLLTNNEVLAVNQDPLGKQATPVRKTETFQIWVRELEDGSLAVGLFNLSDKPAQVPVSVSNDLKTDETLYIRDLWKQKDLGKVRNHFEMSVRPHGARFIRLYSE